MIIFKASKVIPFNQSRLKSIDKNLQQSIGNKNYYSKREGMLKGKELLSLLWTNTVSNENIIKNTQISQKIIDKQWVINSEVKGRQCSVEQRHIEPIVIRSQINSKKSKNASQIKHQNIFEDTIQRNGKLSN